MLKSLPVTKPEELWRVGDKIRCCNWGGYTQDDDGNFSLFSCEAYKNFREHTPEFADLAALQAGNAPLGVRRAGSQGPVDTRNGEYVSGNFFRTLGVQPWIGRLMTDDDDQPGAPPVAVMSYHIWSDKYGSDRFRCGRELSDQRPSLHRDRRRSARLLRCQARRLGHARYLDSGQHRASARWRIPAPQTAQYELARHPRPRAPRRESPSRSKPSCASSSMTGSRATCPTWSPAKSRPGVSRPCISFPVAPVSQPCAINTRPD